MPLSLQLYSSADLMKMQDKANAEARARQRASRVGSLTLKQALQDSGETLTGVMMDVAGNTRRPTLYEMFCTGNRLRGLGLLIAAVAGCMLIIHYFLDYRK